MSKQPEALHRIADLEAMHERGTIRRGHIDEMLTELRRLYALNKELLEALEQFANCELNEDNCASLEVATRRIRSVARAAIAKAKEQT